MLTEDWSGEKHHLNYTSMMYWLCFSVSLSFFCWGKTSFPQSWCVGYQYGKGHVALVTFLTERKLSGYPDLACLVCDRMSLSLAISLQPFRTISLVENPSTNLCILVGSMCLLPCIFIFRWNKLHTCILTLVPYFHPCLSTPIVQQLLHCTILALSWPSLLLQPCSAGWDAARPLQVFAILYTHQPFHSSMEEYTNHLSANLSSRESYTFFIHVKWGDCQPCTTKVLPFAVRTVS